MNGGGGSHTKKARLREEAELFEIVSQVPEAGVETSASAQGNTTLSESGGTSGGTLPDDPRLQAVVDAWRLLNERERQTILKIIHTSSEQSQDV